jgi:MFS transporter, DHA1 family, tetracycline resistance protein
MSQAHGPRRATLVFIFITVLLDMVALGAAVPVLPKLFESFVGDTARGAQLYGYSVTLWALMQFVCSPVHGALSDRFGRRPLILGSNFGLGLDYIVMALAPSVGWLFVGRAISGITAASFSTASAYIADVTPPEKRAASFGLIGVAFGIGFILGPAAGGLLGVYDPRLPFWIAAGLSLLNGAYGLFVLPESLPPEKRSSFSWKTANPIGSLALLRSQPGLLGLAAVAFLEFVAHDVNPAVFVLYTGSRYAWTAATVGLCLAAVGVAAMIVQAGLIRPIVAKLGERRALFVGIAFGTAGFALQGWAPSGAWFFAAVPLGALWGIAMPALQGLATQRVAATDQGKLQGAFSSLMGIALLIGPGLFTQTFARSIGPDAGWLPLGAAYLLAAVILGSALVAAAVVTHAKRADAPA